MLKSLLLVVGLSALHAVVTMAADTPKLLPFQARLTDVTGQPLPDGARVIQFQVFGEPTGGTPLWAGEVHRTTINGGLINVMLGTKNPLPNDRPDDPSRSFFDAALYLQVTPDADANDKITEADPPLLPRQVVLPVVFAKEATVAREVVDGSITAAKIPTNTITAAHLHSSLQADSLVPPGVIVPFAGAAIPSGWLLCDGTEVSRTDETRLFSAVGTTYGEGNGATTFNLPNLKGRVVVGVDPSDTSFNDLNIVGGAKSVTLTTAQMPAHNHFIRPDKLEAGMLGLDSGELADSGDGGGYGYVSPFQRIKETQSAGGGQPHTNMPPFLTLKYIIKR
ncbi:MAG TPA: tail fiber protein [Verrucomicrobiota bacterium]|nr:tail fiber protein [Verrucomicrobiota bacterium]HNU53100.1 tail fiber protein [Verrucomicrobiota bacterium]